MEKREDALASAANNRKEFRTPVKIIADLLASRGYRFKVGVLDLSASGFRIKTANHIDVNQRVYLTIPGFQSLPARVAWNEREYYGCEFALPLHPSVAAHLAQAFPSIFR